jgi:uncharacterized protein (TIGR03086 family)
VDAFEALDRSRDALTQRLAALPEDLSAPSICTGWSIHDLVNHVIGGAVRYCMLIDDASAAAMRATRTHDHLAGDPVGSLHTAADALRAAFRRPGVLDRVMRHPAGNRTGHELLRMRVLEQSLHAVDISRSICRDESTDFLDSALVTFMLDDCLPLIAQLRAGGLYGPRREIDGDETPLLRLLAFTGR